MVFLWDESSSLRLSLSSSRGVPWVPSDKARSRGPDGELVLRLGNFVSNEEFYTVYP